MLEQLFGAPTPEERERISAVPVTVAEERQFGEQAAEAFLGYLQQRQIRVTSRGRDVDYLRRLVEIIRPQMRHPQRYRQLKIYVAEHEATDARSFPGGTIIVFRGLLDFVETEAALVAVLGHELSHLDHGHQLMHLKSIKLASQSFSSQQTRPEDLFRSGTTLMRAFARPFRPEDEAEADRDGALWAYEAGYDPRELARLFARWQERDQQQRDARLSFFRTHPYHEDRLESVLALYDQLQRGQSREQLYLGRRNLRECTTARQQRYDEEVVSGEDL